jgi:hypothetical protein
MDKLVTLHHGGTVKRNELGNVVFKGMQECCCFLVAKKNLRWMDDVVDVILEGVIDVDSSNGTHI